MIRYQDERYFDAPSPTASDRKAVSMEVCKRDNELIPLLPKVHSSTLLPPKGHSKYLLPKKKILGVLR
jgi:hypothetical protein